MKEDIKEKILPNAYMLFILLMIFERLYNYTGISGKYSIYVAVACILLGIIMQVQKNNGNIKLGFLKTVILTFYYPCVESVRYFLFFSLPDIWKKVFFEKQLILYKIIIIISGVFVIVENATGLKRVDGFMYSPTIFSCILLISIYGILFIKEKSRFKILYIATAMFMIFETRSSSIILVAALIILYKIRVLIKNKIILKSKMSKRLSYVLVELVVGIGGFFVFNNIRQILSLVGRSNREQSTETRIQYINEFANTLISNPRTLLVGEGGGFTQKKINSTSKSKNFFPLHQDLLMILCDYGILGASLIYIFSIKKLKLNYISIIVMFLLTFHNLVLTSQVFLLLIITNNRINHDYKFEKLPGYYNA